MRFKKILYLLCFSLFVMLIIQSCGSGNSEEKEKADSTVTVSPPKEIARRIFSTDFQKEEIIRSIKCISDSSKSYSLFLPSDYDTSKSFPVMIFFDAHARGSLPLKKYSALAQKYQFIFIGSNNSQNGMEISETQNIASTLLNDVTVRFNINQKLIFVTGFSGGSKVACNFGFNNSSVRGVIACAAPFTEQLSSVMHSPSVFLLSGNEDFNLSGMVQADNTLNESHFKHQLFVFDGKHDWADKNIFELGMIWVLQQSPSEYEKLQNKIRIINPDYNAWMKTGVTDEKILALEMNDEQEFQKQFTAGDISYWKQKITSLQKSRMMKETFAQSKMHARELNYISVMGFVYSESALNQNNLDAAQHFLEIYELSDPTNPDVFYLKSIYFSKRRDNASAFSSLKKSAQLGYADLSKLNSEPSFSPIKIMNGFDESITKVIINNFNKN